MAESLLKQDTSACLAQALESGKKHVQDYPLSKVQQGLWIAKQLQTCSYLYHIPLVIRLPQTVCMNTLQNALLRVVQENNILTHCFREVGNMVWQYPAKIETMAISVLEINTPMPTIWNIDQDSPLSAFFLDAFNENSPLFRCSLLKTPDTSFLLFCFHHLIIDGLSCSLFLQRLYHYYQFPESILQPEKPSYKDYVAAEKTWVQDASRQNAQAYWLKRLSKTSLTVDLMTDFSRPPVSSGEGRTLHMKLSETLVIRLENVARNLRLPLNLIYLFGFQFLLSRYSGQDDITLGIPLAGRSEKRWYETIGLFVNTCLHAVTLDFTATIAVLLDRTKQQFFEDMSQSHILLDDIIAMLYAEKKANPGQPFNILYNFIHHTPMHFAGDECLPAWCMLPVSKCDFSLHIYAATQSIDLFFEYSTSLYQEDTVKQWMHYYCRILEAIPDHTQHNLVDLSIALSWGDQ